MKYLDWDAVATTNFDDNRRKKLNIMTGKEMFAKAYAREAEAEAAKQAAEAEIPKLKQALLKAMTSKTPIQVRANFSNATESLGGLTKSQEPEDDFYYSGASASRQDPAQRTANATFQEVMETIPAGEVLVFKSLDKQLDQFIFKGSSGQEYAIYTKPQINFQGQVIQNPGYFGLLYNTNLKEL